MKEGLRKSSKLDPTGLESALQTLHKVSSRAREQNFYLGGLSHDWVSYYEQRIESDRSCLNEWNAMDNLESRRPSSPDSVRNKPRERAETERVIRATLKEIMMSVDLDEVTSKYIRGRLEEDLDMDLGEFKPFIDQEMLMILGQMDAPTEIFDHVYLGSEWNASNLEELQKNGVKHILNVTKEIDNFFPGMFSYRNIRVYDDEKTELLKYWDDTFKYISKARKEGSKVLVHCKMGVSRSASVVIAYAMKAYNWNFSQAWKYVKDKRNCIKPNNSFLLQLETYQGILDAMKNKEKLQRSKSDTNLKCPTISRIERTKEIPHCIALDKQPNQKNGIMTERTGKKSEELGKRPKSWSFPHIELESNVYPVIQMSQSLMSIDRSALVLEGNRETLLRGTNRNNQADQEARNVLMPCGNGQSYSVSQNQIVHLPGPDGASVENRVSKLETKVHQTRKGLVLNLTNQFEASGSKPSSPEYEGDRGKLFPIDLRVVENGYLVNTITKSFPRVQNPEKKTYASGCSTGTQTKGFEISTENRTVLSKHLEASGRSGKDGNMHNAQVDRVFKRGEKKVPTNGLPSRHSSWSDYDSAVVLNDHSIHSFRETFPSRNNSWGSHGIGGSNDNLGLSGLFPYDKEDIPWHPGTVKRTKQKIEEGNTVKKVCTLSKGKQVNDQWKNNVGENPTVEGFNLMIIPRTNLPHISKGNDLKLKRFGNSPMDIRGIDISQNPRTKSIGRLSTSAPAPSALLTDVNESPPKFLRSYRSENGASSASVAKTYQCPSVNYHKMVLENMNKSNLNERCSSAGDSPPELVGSSSSLSSSSSSLEGPRNSYGFVKNLKKEFEAKSSKFEKNSETWNSMNEHVDGQYGKQDPTVIRSLPSSPIIGHSDSKMRSSTCVVKVQVEEIDSDGERQDGSKDLSVKVLVGKYEIKPDSGKSGDVKLRPYKDRNWEETRLLAQSKTSTHEFLRRSAPVIIDSSMFPLGASGAPGRPSVIPPSTVISTTLVTKHSNKKFQQQHGKTHPLARLQVRPRHSSPLYNTM